MKIYGLSPSSGVERQLNVEKGIDGVVLTIIDQAGRKEQGRLSIPGDNLAAAIMDATPLGSTVKALPSPHGMLSQIEVQVRRNEVWLTMSSEAGVQADIAVGFDDLQDALEEVISRV